MLKDILSYGKIYIFIFPGMDNRGNTIIFFRILNEENVSRICLTTKFRDDSFLLSMNGLVYDLTTNSKCPGEKQIVTHCQFGPRELDAF